MSKLSLACGNGERNDRCEDLLTITETVNTCVEEDTGSCEGHVSIDLAEMVTEMNDTGKYQRA